MPGPVALPLAVVPTDSRPHGHGAPCQRPSHHSEDASASAGHWQFSYITGAPVGSRLRHLTQALADTTTINGGSIASAHPVASGRTPPIGLHADRASGPPTKTPSPFCHPSGFYTLRYDAPVLPASPSLCAVARPRGSHA